MCASYNFFSDPLKKKEKKNDYSIARGIVALLTSRKMWISQYILPTCDGKKMCTPDSDLCAIVFRKKKNILWLLEITVRFYTKEKWMHYVILITHQSDIKICTTNFSDLPVNDKSHYSHSNRCSFSQHVCAMRRSLITFRFFKTSKVFFPSSPCCFSRRIRFSLQQCVIAHKKKLRGCRNGSKLLQRMPILRKLNEKKNVI